MNFSSKVVFNLNLTRKNIFFFFFFSRSKENFWLRRECKNLFHFVGFEAR